MRPSFSAMPVVLGINAFHADASACVLRDGRIVVAVAEERLGPRHKHHAGFPARAIVEALRTAKVGIGKSAYLEVMTGASGIQTMKATAGGKRGY
jgi:carbamoyltransferase